eukprot:COSAG01_NODE_5371_length_4302_cov_2.525577_3_plen_1251_part_01
MRLGLTSPASAGFCALVVAQSWLFPAGQQQASPAGCTANLFDSFGGGSTCGELIAGGSFSCQDFAPGTDYAGYCDRECRFGACCADALGVSVPVHPCGVGSPCNGHGSCLCGSTGTANCSCTQQFGGSRCEQCAPGFTGYPSCAGVVCSLPPMIVNGRPDSVSNGGRYPSRAVYLCDDGYELVDPRASFSASMCGVDGLWSSVAHVRCRARLCQGLDPPGRYESRAGQRVLLEALGTITYTNSRRYPSTATYHCNPGYQRGSRDTVSWQRDCRPNGSWTGDDAARPPTCVGVACQSLANHAHGWISGTSGNNNGSRFPSSVLYSCHPGYELVGAAQRQCATTGGWQPAAPYCRGILCSNLSQSAGTKSVRYTNNGRYPSTATYSCHPGFLMSGAPSQRCEVSGRWAPGAPNCSQLDHSKSWSWMATEPEPEPEPAPSHLQPEPEPEPSASQPEPEPEPTPSVSQPQPEPEPSASQPEPEPEPEPSQLQPEPEPTPSVSQPEPEPQSELKPAQISEPEPEPDPKSEIQSQQPVPQSGFGPVDCSKAPDCQRLQREPCFRRANSCGSCILGTSTMSGHSDGGDNEPCGRLAVVVNSSVVTMGRPPSALALRRAIAVTIRSLNLSVGLTYSVDRLAQTQKITQTLFGMPGPPSEYTVPGPSILWGDGARQIEKVIALGLGLTQDNASVTIHSVTSLRRRLQYYVAAEYSLVTSVDVSNVVLTDWAARFHAVFNLTAGPFSVSLINASNLSLGPAYIRTEIVHAITMPVRSALRAREYLAAIVSVLSNRTLMAQGLTNHSSLLECRANGALQFLPSPPPPPPPPCGTDHKCVTSGLPMIYMVYLLGALVLFWLCCATARALNTKQQHVPAETLDPAGARIDHQVILLAVEEHTSDVAQLESLKWRLRECPSARSLSRLTHAQCRLAKRVTVDRPSKLPAIKILLAPLHEATISALQEALRKVGIDGSELDPPLSCTEKARSRHQFHVCLCFCVLSTADGITDFAFTFTLLREEGRQDDGVQALYDVALVSLLSRTAFSVVVAASCAALKALQWRRHLRAAERARACAAVAPPNSAHMSSHPNSSLPSTGELLAERIRGGSMDTREYAVLPIRPQSAAPSHLRQHDMSSVRHARRPKSAAHGLGLTKELAALQDQLRRLHAQSTPTSLARPSSAPLRFFTDTPIQVAQIDAVQQERQAEEQCQPRRAAKQDRSTTTDPVQDVTGERRTHRSALLLPAIQGRSTRAILPALPAISET